MVKVVVQILDEKLAHPDALTGKELERAVDADLEAFNKFFSAIDNNSNLTGPERSIVKTYLWWKIHPEGEVRGT